MSTLPPEEPPQLTLESIDTGISLVEAKEHPDPIDLLEKEKLETARLENKLARSKIKNVKADRNMRKQYAGRILQYLEFYSIGVGGLVLLSGFGLFGFKLEPNVLSTLVGSTAVAAIGLVGFIARGLFRPPNE